MVAHLGLEFATPYTQVCDESDGPMWTRWFGGGRINLTHNCVDRHARESPERTAVIWESEDGQVRTVSYGELEAEVNRIGNALLQLGVEPGQTVGLFLPMSVEVVAGFYAICKIGAIAVPIFSGFGAPARGRAAERRGCGGAADGRRGAAPRQAGLDEGGRRRGARAGAVGAARCGVGPAGHAAGDAQRARPPLARAGGEPAGESCPRRRSTRRRR